MTEKYRPTLNANLVEGLLAECLSQIKLSLDCCHSWKEGNLTLQENILATRLITRDEVWNVLDVTQYHTRKTMRPKQWLFLERCRRYTTDQKSIELTKDSTEAQYEVYLKSLIKFLGDAHLILSETTSPELREYLANGTTPEEKKRRGYTYSAPPRLASKRKIAKGKRGAGPRPAKGVDPGRVRKRGDGGSASRKARSHGEDDSSLERVGGLAKVHDVSIRSDSGESPERDQGEGGDLGDRGDGGDRVAASEAQGSVEDSNGDDERSIGQSDGLSERGSVPPASSDQGGIGDRSERVGFGPENMGLGRPGEDFDNGYLRSLERHRTISGEESSSRRGEVLAMSDQLNDMIEALQAAAVDMARFEGGNDAAGRRVRKVCAEVGKACKGIRADVQEVRNRRKG